MAADTAIDVSKRLRRPGLALMCLITMQVLVSLSTCHPEQLPMAARVAVNR
jgi:hypothetical protein